MALKRLAYSTGIGSTAVGSLVLIGWLFDVVPLKSGLPGLSTMKANTALAFVFLGLALVFFLRDQRVLRRWSLVLAGLAVGIGALTLFEYGTNIDLGIDQLLFHDPAAAFPGRPAIATALNMVLLGVAICCLRFRRLSLVSYGLAAAAIVVAFIALLGYLYDVDALYGTFFFHPIALHTTLMFLVLSYGVIFARSDHPTLSILTAQGAGGMVMRRLAPAVVLIGILLNVLEVTLENAGAFNKILGHALMLAVNVVLMTAVVVWNARYLQRIDAERSRAQAALVRSNRAFRTLSDFNQMLVRTQDEATLTKALARILVETGNYTRAEVFLLAEDADSGLTTSAPAFQFEIKAAQQAADSVLPEFPAITRQRIMETALRSSKPQFFTLEAAAVDQAALRVVILPVIGTECPFGALLVYSAGVERYSAEEVNLFSEIAGDLAYGLTTLQTRLANERAAEQIHYQASLINHVLEAIIATDLDGVIRAWNKGAELIYGWTAEEAIGQTARVLLATEISDKQREESLQAIREDGQWRGEVIQVKKDGSKLEIRSTTSMLYDSKGVEIGVVACNRDISQFKFVERAWVRTEQQFALVFEEALDVFLIIDEDKGFIIEANRAAERVLGYKKDALIGKHFAALFPSDAEYIAQKVMEEVQFYDTIFDLPPFLRADGSICLMDLTGNVIPWRDGRAILVTLRDMTEQVQAAKARLEAEMLRTTINKERELIELREKFIATVSHEFRTPLAVIMSSYELLTRYELTPEKYESHMNKIRTQVEYMVRLLDGVLTFSKLRSGRVQADVQIINVDRFVYELFEQIMTTLNHDKVIPHYHSSGALDSLPMDAALLQHILVNLLTNAIKYSKSGGHVYVEVRRGGRRAGRRDAQPETDGVQLIVRDEGIGIPLQDQSRLFEPFQRAGNAQGISGTGLGMAIVYESVQRCGGSISFESVENEGTTFIVWLPLLYQPALEHSS